MNKMGVNDLSTTVLSDGLELLSSNIDSDFLSPNPTSSGPGLFASCYDPSFSYSTPNQLKINNSPANDYPFLGTTTTSCESTSLCVGCGKPIHDQYILRVSPNLEWHAGCLKCVECNELLDEHCTCFIKNGKTYCKRDYTKLFSTRCAKCGISFNQKDYVIRALNHTYHVNCFRCAACQRQLLPGDEFGVRDDRLLCRMDYDITLQPDIIGTTTDHHHLPGYSPSTRNLHRNVHSAGSLDGSVHTSGVLSGHQRSSGSIQKRKDSKTTRVRTVLNEKQLHTLRTCYAANCRPDALMKEQLTEMTGLSARVIRVWFQNKRCKDKKRSLALKQMQEQQANQQNAVEQNGNNNSSNISCINGIPMVASEPVRNDSANPQPIEVRNCQQPAWKALRELDLQNELEQPVFQQFMNPFSDQGHSSMSDSSEICSIPSVSSASMDISTTSSTPLNADVSGTVCS